MQLLSYYFSHFYAKIYALICMLYEKLGSLPKFPLNFENCCVGFGSAVPLSIRLSLVQTTFVKPMISASSVMHLLKKTERIQEANALLWLYTSSFCKSQFKLRGFIKDKHQLTLRSLCNCNITFTVTSSVQNQTTIVIVGILGFTDPFKVVRTYALSFHTSDPSSQNVLSINSGSTSGNVVNCKRKYTRVLTGHWLTYS